MVRLLSELIFELRDLCKHLWVTEDNLDMSPCFDWSIVLVLERGVRANVVARGTSD